MRIAVIGGGNIGTLMGAEFAAKGHDVRMLVSGPGNWSNTIDVFDQDDRLVLQGVLSLVTDDLSAAVADAEMIWVTYPTFMLADIAQRLLPFAAKGVSIGVVPGNDAEFFFAEHVNRGATLFGLQRVHSVARLRQKGRSVYMLGRKPEVQVAALPSCQTAGLARLIGDLFDLPAVELPNYLVETLTPSNPILHTARIRSMFSEWGPGVTYDHNILFYEEWDLPSAQLLLACDDELQVVCRALEKELLLDLSEVKSLREHYESPDATAMAAKISSISAFKGLTSPLKETAPGEWAPDFQSRYFKADFSFGLKAIKDIAALVGVDTPNINDVYNWYVNASRDKVAFNGVPATIDELRAIYA